MTPRPPSPPGAATPRRQAFRLVRYFSLVSLGGLVVATAALLWAYRALTEHHLVEHETRANAELQGYLFCWPLPAGQLRSFLASSSAGMPATLPA